MKLRAVKIEKMFIPEFNENKKLPATEQVKLYFHRIPGTSEKANYKNFKYEQGGAIQLVNNDNMIISTFVSKVENLDFDDGSRIKNGAELSTASNPALEPLFSEIRNYLFPDGDEFSEGESEA